MNHAADNALKASCYGNESLEDFWDTVDKKWSVRVIELNHIGKKITDAYEEKEKVSSKRFRSSLSKSVCRKDNGVQERRQSFGGESVGWKPSKRSGENGPDFIGG